MILALMKKEFLQLRRDPRLVGLIIVMPLVMLILFGFALRLEPVHMNLACVDQDHSFFSNLVKTGLWNEGHFKLYEVGSRDDVMKDIRSGKAKAGVVIESGFSEKLIENQQPHITFYVDGTMPSLTTAMKYRSQGATDEDVTNSMYFSDPDGPPVVIADDPFVMDTVVLFNPEEKETWFFLPGIVGVLVMQVTLILTGISVVREREKQTLEQLLSTPLTKLSFVIGKVSPYIVISLVDFYVILCVGWTLFKLPMPLSQWSLFCAAVLFVSVMICIGFFISLISKTQQQAMFMAVFILIPSVLLSGFIFPLEAIPAEIRVISYMIPFTYFTEIMRSLLIKQTEFKDLVREFASLSLYFSIVFVSCVGVFRKKL